MAKTIDIDGSRIKIESTKRIDKLHSLKLAYQKHEEINITLKEIVGRLIDNAKLKDIL